MRIENCFTESQRKQTECRVCVCDIFWSVWHNFYFSNMFHIFRSVVDVLNARRHSKTALTHTNTWWFIFICFYFFHRHLMRCITFSPLIYRCHLRPIWWTHTILSRAKEICARIFFFLRYARLKLKQIQMSCHQYFHRRQEHSKIIRLPMPRLWITPRNMRTNYSQPNGYADSHRTLLVPGWQWITADDLNN